MKFAWPIVLVALIIPLALAALQLRRRRQQTTSYPKILRAVASSRSFTISPAGLLPAAVRRVHWRFWTALALSIVALSRPQWGRLDEPVYDESQELMIALDLSRSMLATDIRPSRLERSKLLITSLLEHVKGERVGLVVFAGTAFLQCPLSSDYEILREFLPSLTPAYLPEGGTNYKALLETALESFSESPNTDRFLVVLSDGESLADDWKPLVAKLKEQRVRVIGLGLGTTEGTLVHDENGQLIKDDRGAAVISKLEPSTLKSLAAETNGAYASATGWVDWPALLAPAAGPSLQKTKGPPPANRLAEQFQWFLAGAFFLFLWSLWREFPVHPRSRAIAAKALPLNAGLKRPENEITATSP